MSDLLARARTPELCGGQMLLIPVGSTEQHGPHLPLGMDTVIAQAVANRAGDVIRDGGVDVLIAPALASLREGGWLTDGAVLVAETALDDDAPSTDGFTLLDERAYGDTRVLFLGT